MTKPTKIALLLAFACSLLVVGCAKDPEQMTETGNPEFEVATLFTHAGCTVFRFRDAGRYHYFTNCQGETLGRYTTSCGAGCVRSKHETVPTTIER